LIESRSEHGARQPLASLAARTCAALWAEATRDELTWTQSWQVGDLVIWDNRCTMHRRESFAGHDRRRMHRLMTLGERPV
jgi:alpha-ketoglutarate-dependent taurine dioxygenase